MPPREPQPLFWPMAHSVQNHQNTPSPPRGSSRIGPERHRNIDILIPLARQRESPTGPNVPCERRTDPAEPHRPQAPGASPGTPPPQHRCGPPGGMRRSFRTHRLCAIPRGFTPGWYPLPRWGTPNASPFPEPPPPPRPHLPHRPHAITTTHRVNDDCFISTATTKPSHRGTYPQSTKRQRARSGASIGTSTS
jgi:hypothetical protein